jgi:spore coat polysaccharide biosynthesis protein SpsF (cytidylyltransferase family)
VACPDTQPNHAIADLCAKHGYACVLHPGDPTDVLGRFHAVAEQYHTVTIARICGDTPLLCPDVFAELVQAHHAAVQGIPYAVPSPGSTPLLQPRGIHVTYPDLTGIGLTWGDGFDAEIMTRQALAIAHAEAVLPSEREHVSSFLYTRPQRFRCVSMPCPFNLSWLRLSVDAPADLAMASTVLAAVLDRVGPTYGWRDVWQAVERLPAVKAQMQARAHNPAYVAQVTTETGEQRDWATLRYGRDERRCQCGSAAFACGHNPRAYVFPGTNSSLRYDGSWGQSGDAH